MQITKEEQEQLAPLIEEYRTNVAAFVLDMWGEGEALRPKQLEFCDAFLNNNKITIRGGVGFGKTRWMAVMTLWALITHDEVKVTIFGPGEVQIKNGIWNEVKSLYGKMPEIFREGFEMTETGIKRTIRPADCWATFQLTSKENVETARGIHVRNNFVMVDEATGVADEIFDVLKGVLVDANGKLCLISNPSRTSGYFYDTWNKPLFSDSWTKCHGRMQDNPDLSPEKMKELAIEYGGVGSQKYRVMVDGEFPDSDVEGLIPLSLVQMAIENEDAIPSHNQPIIWGVDPAGPGRDRSILIKRHDNVIIGQPIELDGTITQLSYKLRDLFQAEMPSTRPAVIAVDANGIGRGLADNLKDWGLPVQAVVSQSSPTRKPEKYSRLRDQLWWETLEWFQTENVRIPHNPQLVRELTAPTWEDINNKIKVEAKKDLKKRIKVSPDIADALCLTFAVSPTRYASKYNWSAR